MLRLLYKDIKYRRTTNNHSTIFDKQEFLEYLNDVPDTLQLTHNAVDIQIYYKIIMNPQNSTVFEFINRNYKPVNTYGKLFLQTTFSEAVLNQLVQKDDLCFQFYSKIIDNNNNYLEDELIGIGIGTKSNIYIRSNLNDSDNLGNVNNFNRFSSFKISFLCVKKQFRSEYIVSYITNIMTKYIINKETNIDIISYKTYRKKNDYFFSKRLYYFRPINIESLIKDNILKLSDTNTLDLLKKLYNTFSYDFSLKQKRFLQYIKEEELDSFQLSSIIDIVYDKIESFYKSNFDIYEIYSKEFLKNLFINPSFHKFIIRDQNNNITDFFCLYETSKYSKSYNGEHPRNLIIGNFYIMAPESKPEQSVNSDKNKNMDNSENNNTLSNLLELVAEYCYHHSLFDMISIPNLLNIKSYEYPCHKLLKTSEASYYYLINMQMSFINSYKNALE